VARATTRREPFVVGVVVAPRPVEAGAPLGRELGPMLVPDGTDDLIRVMDGTSQGIVYEVNGGKPLTPQPDPVPNLLPDPGVLPSWVTSRPLWVAIVAGISIAAIMAWVIEAIGVVVLAG
jgi:hypothetical protein